MKYEKGQFTTVPNIKYLSGLKSTTTSTYMWICSYADENGQCYPKRKTLAEKILVDVKTIDRAIIELCELGLLEKSSRFNGVSQSSNKYQILIKEDGGGDTTPTGGATSEPYPQGHHTHTELNPLKLNPSNQTKNKFDVWWDSYPMRRVDKEKCKTKFGKFPEEVQEQIIADTKKRTLEDEKWKKGFVPMTSTYLNNKKWEDDYEKVEVRSTGVKVYE